MVSEELDLAVLEFLEEERAAGRVVRNKDLSTRALEIAGKPSFLFRLFRTDCMHARPCVCVCVCVSEREGVERERERWTVRMQIDTIAVGAGWADCMNELFVGRMCDRG